MRMPRSLDGGAIVGVQNLAAELLAVDGGLQTIRRSAAAGGTIGRRHGKTAVDGGVLERRR